MSINTYKKCKYVLSLIPLENDYLFKKWGINSILIENLVPYEYNSVLPSDLFSKNIIMIGRAYDPIKRYDLGIKAMKFIIEEIPDCKMNIISSPYNKLIQLIKNFNLENNIIFTGFTKNPENYFKNSSLHILCSLSETYPLVLAETKIFGIPTILCGLDYLSLAKGGTIIIYDDNPRTIAEESIKLLKNDTLRKILGNEARNSMKEHSNELIIKKWTKILHSVYKSNETNVQPFIMDNKLTQITEQEANIILNNQLKLLKFRIPTFGNLTLEKFKSFSLN